MRISAATDSAQTYKMEQLQKEGSIYAKKLEIEKKKMVKIQFKKNKKKK